MKKKIYSLLVLASIVSLVSHGMELVDLAKNEVSVTINNIKNDQTAQTDLSKLKDDVVILGKDVVKNKNINNLDVKNDLGPVESDLVNLAKEMISNKDFSPQGSASMQTPVINVQPSHASQVPRLNLNPSLAKAKSGNIPKTPIKSQTQLIQEINKAARTHRQMLSDSNNGQISYKPGQDTVIDIGNVTNNNIPQKRSMLPRGLVDNDTNIDVAQEIAGKTTAEIWVFLSVVNPVLYQFGIEGNMSLDEVEMYGSLLNEFHVHPEALVEFIKNSSNVVFKDNKFSVGQEKGVTEKQIQKYQKIQNKDPEKYKGLVLEVLKTVVSQQEGEKTTSPLNDTHIQMLEKQAAETEGTVRYQYIALFVGAFLTLAGYAWGIYGQATGHPANPTNAPTHAPTSPTFMPTGAPT